MAKVKEKEKHTVQLSLTRKEAGRLKQLLYKGCDWDKSGKIGDLCDTLYLGLSELGVDEADETFFTPLS